MNSNRLPRLKYHSPKTTEEVLEIKHTFADDSVILAGGTDVIPMLKRRNVSCRHVINIKKIISHLDQRHDSKKRIMNNKQCYLFFVPFVVKNLLTNNA